MTTRLFIPAAIATLAIILAVQPASARPALASSNNPCAPSDSVGLRLRGELQTMIADTDSAAVVARDSIYHVPTVPASSITFVTDSLVCQQVATVFTSRRIDTTAAATTRVYVLNLNGIAYAAQDAVNLYSVLILNPQFAVTGGYSGP